MARKRRRSASTRTSAARARRGPCASRSSTSRAPRARPRRRTRSSSSPTGEIVRRGGLRAAPLSFSREAAEQEPRRDARPRRRPRPARSGTAIATVTTVAASSSCQSSRRLAIIQAASGRNSANSSGSAWGSRARISLPGVMPSWAASAEASPPMHVGLGAEREEGGAHHEPDRERSGLLVHPPVEAAALRGRQRQRAAGHEARDAGQRVQRQHQRVADQDVHVVAEGGVDVVARDQVPRLVRRGELRHRVDGEQQRHRDGDAEQAPWREDRDGRLVPAPERELRVVHALDEHEVVDAHPLRIGTRARQVEPRQRYSASRRAFSRGSSLRWKPSRFIT